MKTLFFLLSAFLVIPLSAQGDWPLQSLVAQHFTVDDGLPIDEVWELEQDRFGLIWIGTQRGLAVYDGENISAFDFAAEILQKDSVSITNNIRAMTIGPDDHLWLTTIDGAIVYFDRIKEEFFLVPVPAAFSDKAPKLQEFPDDIVFDDQGHLWVNSVEDGIYRITLTAPSSTAEQIAISRFTRLHPVDNRTGDNFLFSMVRDEANNIWVLHLQGLSRWDDTKQRFELVYQEKNPPESDYSWGALTVGRNGRRLFMVNSKHEIISYDPESNTVRNLHRKYQLEGLSAIQLFEDQDRRLWVGFGRWNSMEIGWIDPDHGGFEQIHFQFRPPSLRLRTQIAQDFLQDREGNVWIGIHAGALVKYSPHKSVFQQIPLVAPRQRAAIHRITQVLVDGNDDAWIRSMDWMIRKIDQSTGEMQTLLDLLPANIKNKVTISRPYLLQTDSSGNIWFRESNQLFRYDHRSHTVHHLSSEYTVLDSLPDSYIQGFDIGTDGTIWILCQAHIFHINLAQNVILQEILPGKWAGLKSDSEEIQFIPSRLTVDSRGNIWIGTQNNGFFMFNPVTEKAMAFPYSPGSYFLAHPNGCMYVGTHSDGIVEIDIKTLDHRPITKDQGLPSDNIRGGMILDQDNRLWVGTDRGLVRIDPSDRSLSVFTTTDGLPTNLLSTQMAGIRSDGYLIFGTLDGLLKVDPGMIKQDSIPPTLLFRTLRIFDTPLKVTPKGPLKKSLLYPTDISLRHQQNNITISFAAVHHKNPAKNQYAARLLPYQQGFRDLGTINQVSYNNLDPGRYTLQVKAANSDGVWNEEGISLDIFIRPPWYWNPWSKLLYFLMTAGVIYGLYRFQLNRRLAFAEANRLRELDEVKTNLYTNITHEFRTPLTVIKGITEQIQGHETEKRLIERNSDQVLNLVQQMLDLAKVDAGQASVQMVHGDILYFLRYVVESFHSLAFQQKVSLHFYAEEEEIHMDYDPEKIMGILSNIISNAIKFTPEYGKIQVVARQSSDRDQEQKVLELLIKDTGVGIDQAHLPFLFDRFYQVDASRTRRGEGTGIGLSLTKEWVELMDGHITVESEVDRGTTFLVQLPINHEAEDADSSVLIAPLRPGQGNHAGRHATQPPPNWLEKITERPLLLIVEDNLDVQHYLTLCLESEYRLVFARNGREGLDRAHQYIPDLIISDVMMPEMDGFELCHQLKTDHRTSHIPIIMLTARASAQDRITGLQKGADAYLAKPFSREELQVRLEKLIELRRRLREKYSQGFPLPEPDSVSEDTEMAFLQKLHQTVMSNLEREDFKLDQLARELAMSRMQLHRKLKALTDQTPAQYVKQIRMAYAKKLLLETTLSVSEVATKVGFRSHAHFSTAFKDFFGTAPSKV